jgi:hypothetical protein
MKLTEKDYKTPVTWYFILLSIGKIRKTINNIILFAIFKYLFIRMKKSMDNDADWE